MSNRIVVRGQGSGVSDSEWRITTREKLRKFRVKMAITAAFEAFAPEAVGMETLAHETGLSQAIVADCLIEMARRKEIIVSTEDIVIADDGTLSHKLAFPTLITGMTCYSMTTYRVNKDRKQEAA